MDASVPCCPCHGPAPWPAAGTPWTCWAPGGRWALGFVCPSPAYSYAPCQWALVPVELDPLAQVPPGTEGLPQQRDLLYTGGRAGTAKGSGKEPLTPVPRLHQCSSCQGSARWRVQGPRPSALGPRMSLCPHSVSSPGTPPGTPTSPAMGPHKHHHPISFGSSPSWDPPSPCHSLLPSAQGPATHPSRGVSQSQCPQLIHLSVAEPQQSPALPPTLGDPSPGMPPFRDPGTALMAAVPHRAGGCAPPQYEH